MNREQLKAIIEEETALAGGTLQPEHLVKRAKVKAHPLHAEIWGTSDAKAALSWRVDLARNLIRSVWVEVVGKTTAGTQVCVPLMVHDTRAAPGVSGFRRFVDVAEDRVESYATLEVELKALRGHFVRAMSIAEGLGLADEARAGIASWEALMGTLAKRGVVVPVEKVQRRRPSVGDGAQA